MTAVEREMSAVRGGRWARARRVDHCLLRGGEWFALDLMACTGLGSGAIYVRLAQLERAGFVTSMVYATDGRRSYEMVDELLIRHRKERFHQAMRAGDA